MSIVFHKLFQPLSLSQSHSQSQSHSLSLCLDLLTLVPLSFVSLYLYLAKLPHLLVVAITGHCKRENFILGHYFVGAYDWHLLHWRYFAGICNKKTFHWPPLACRAVHKHLRLGPIYNWFYSGQLWPPSLLHQRQFLWLPAHLVKQHFVDRLYAIFYEILATISENFEMRNWKETERETQQRSKTRGGRIRKGEKKTKTHQKEIQKLCTTWENFCSRVTLPGELMPPPWSPGASATLQSWRILFGPRLWYNINHNSVAKSNHKALLFT